MILKIYRVHLNSRAQNCSFGWFCCDKCFTGLISNPREIEEGSIHSQNNFFDPKSMWQNISQIFACICGWVEVTHTRTDETPIVGTALRLCGLLPPVHQTLYPGAEHLIAVQPSHSSVNIWKSGRISATFLRSCSRLSSFSLSSFVNFANFFHVWNMIQRILL